MKTSLFRQPKTDAVGSDEPDFPLPGADPSVRPMHRECALGGCLYRSRFLFNAGWALAVTFLLVAAASAAAWKWLNLSRMDDEVAELRKRIAGQDLQLDPWRKRLKEWEALQKENTILYQQMDAQREELAAVSARAAVTPPAEKGADKAVAPPNAAPETRRAANESTRRPPPRRAPPSKPSTQNAVPESEKWWNRP